MSNGPSNCMSPCVGIEERRKRERAQRREDILRAAWVIAEKHGYASFSLEKVAAEAEIGRATVYSYFVSLDDLIVEMAKIALQELEDKVADADGVSKALDVPVRMAQSARSRFDLLFPQSVDPREHMNNRELNALRERARSTLGCIERVAQAQASALPKAERDRIVFLAGVSMAGATVPELKSSTTLRHRFQNFCLREDEPGD